MQINFTTIFRRISELCGFVVAFCRAFPFVAVAIGVCILGAIIFVGIQKSCSNRDDRKIDTQGNIANTYANNSLIIEGKVKEQERQIENLNAERINANVNINRHLENINRIRNEIYNVNLQDAEKARCRAYPEDCQK